MEQQRKDEMRKIEYGLGWIELEKSLNENGCPVCNSMLRALRKYFEYLLYEYALDAGVHKKIIASAGMCNTHTYILKETEHKLNSDGLNIAVLYETTFQKEIKLLNKNKKAKLKEADYNPFNLLKKKSFILYKQKIISELITTGNCPGCEQQKNSESFFTHEILRSYLDDEFRNKYEDEKILLCRAHFLFLINESKEKEAFDYFIEIQKKKIEKLNSQLSGFIQNHDYRLHQNMKEEEKLSWHKALEYTGSMKNIDRNSYNELITL